MPGKDFDQVYAICPFFQKSDAKNSRIFCDGFSKSANISLNFGRCKRAYREFRADYCNSFDHKECPIYKMLWDEA